MAEYTINLLQAWLPDLMVKVRQAGLDVERNMVRHLATLNGSSAHNLNLGLLLFRSLRVWWCLQQRCVFVSFATPPEPTRVLL